MGTRSCRQFRGAVVFGPGSLGHEPLEDRQGKLDHAIATGQREADVARQSHDLSGHHQHLLFQELLGELDAAEASRTPKYIEYVFFLLCRLVVH